MGGQREDLKIVTCHLGQGASIAAIKGGKCLDTSMGLTPLAGIPMGRMGTPEELGELAAFLASTESSYITGQGIVIDGASTLPETRSVGV